MAGSRAPVARRDPLGGPPCPLLRHSAVLDANTPFGASLRKNMRVASASASLPVEAVGLMACATAVSPAGGGT